MEDDEGKDDEGPIEVFGVHRLELAPGTMSGYIGVRPNKSKKHPWQAWLSLRGEKRRKMWDLSSCRGCAACCGGQGSGKGLWCRDLAESAKAGSAQ